MIRRKVSLIFNLGHYFTLLINLSIEEKKEEESEEKPDEDPKGFGDTKDEDKSKEPEQSYGGMFRSKVQGFFFDP